MTVEEFSTEFDILYNSIMSNQAPSVDDYEKSVFLTKAQENIVISLYNGKNPFGESFEETEENRRYLANLIKTAKITTKETNISTLSYNPPPNSICFKLPEDVWFIIYESGLFDDPTLGCLNNQEPIIIPVTHDDYFNMSENPFRGPSKRRVLRLDIENNIVELITNYNISYYLVRYLRKPNPIVLVDLDTIGNGLTIDGISDKTECELSTSIHRTILEKAVQLAKEAYMK